MNDDDYEVTIGTGGWVLVVLSGIVTFGVLRWLMLFLLFPAVVFGIAIALIVLLLLYWLAGKVGGSEEGEVRSVRKIVPAAGDARHDGVAGPAVKAVPVRPEALKTQRSSSVVTPLAEVGPAPIIAQSVVAEAVMPAVAPAEAAVERQGVELPEAKPAPNAKAAAKEKAGSAPKSDAKPKAGKSVARPTSESAAPSLEKAKAKPKAEAKPKAAKPKAEKPAGPVRLKAPRKGRADDLQEIEGIGPALEKLVNEMGFFHFDQIAAWSEADIASIDAEMKTFKGRIARDKWVEQARIIVKDGLEAFRERARTNDY